MYKENTNRKKHHLSLYLVPKTRVILVEGGVERVVQIAEGKVKPLQSDVCNQLASLSAEHKIDAPAKVTSHK